MKNKSRTQKERSAGTRAALVSAGRSLFAERGFQNVATEDIVQEAAVTRGALYHHFADKTELFAAVFEAVEEDVVRRIGAAMVGEHQSDPIAIMCLGANTWLDACGEPEIHRIALLDAPAVLGLVRWREIAARYGMGLVEAMLRQAMEAGRVPRQPAAPLAHVLLGALREAALYIAEAPNRERARREVGTVILNLVRSLQKAPSRARRKSK
jgi:AcrR family transcriptional regulator